MCARRNIATLKLRHCAAIAAVRGTIQPVPATAVFIAETPVHLFQAAAANAVVCGEPVNSLDFAKEKRRLLT